MRRLLFALFMCMSIGVYAQENEKEFDCYISARVAGRALENVHVTLPEGEEGANLLDDNKELFHLESTLDIFNYFAAKGWTYVTIYYEDLLSRRVTWYVFKKKVRSIDQVYKEIPSEVVRKKRSSD